MSTHSIIKALDSLAKAVPTDQGRWILGGSTALMLRGLTLAAEPRDIDIYCDEEDSQRIYELLKNYALDTPVISQTAIYHSRLSHYMIEDVEVELVGGFKIRTASNEYCTRVKKELLPSCDYIALPGCSMTVPIVPLAHELLFNWLRDRMDRVAIIIDAFNEKPYRHDAGLSLLMKSNGWSLEFQNEIYRLIHEGRAGEDCER